MNEENLSLDTIKKLEKMGWKLELSSVPKKDSYFNVFVNKYSVNLTLVKSPLEVPNTWLGTIWSNIERKSIDISDSYNFETDKPNRFVLKEENDVLEFAKAVDKFVKNKYKGLDID